MDLLPPSDARIPASKPDKKKKKCYLGHPVLPGIAAFPVAASFHKMGPTDDHSGPGVTDPNAEVRRPGDCRAVAGLHRVLLKIGRFQFGFPLDSDKVGPRFM